MSIFDEYKDPIVFVPNTSGQLKEITETITIINSRAVLQQIPDELSKPTISGYTEIQYGEPQTNEFLVDYVTGVLTFNSSITDKTQLEVHYWGRGALHVSASRIFALHKSEDIIQNLQDMIDNTQAGIDALSQLTDAVNHAYNLEHKGVYDSTIGYLTGNIVWYEGSTYMAIADTTAGTAPTNTTYWEKITSFRWKGTYSSTTTYEYGDTVIDSVSENVYMSIIDNNSGKALTDTTAWANMVSVTDAVNHATTQGDYAKAQGDYAKQWGNHARNVEHKGNYDALVAYKEGNIVWYQGTTYMAIADTVAGTAPTDSTYWKKITNYNWAGTYSSTATYNYGDVVKDSVNENVYMSIIESNTGKLLTDTTAWVNFVSVTDAVNHATTQGDYAKTQGDYAKGEGDYAKNQGNYAKTTADNLEHKGTWDSTLAYKRGNIVWYEGASYIAISDISAGTSLDSSLYWRKLTNFKWESVYDSLVTYEYGDTVVDSGRQEIYMSIVDGNVGNLLSDTTKWEKIATVKIASDYANTQGDYAKQQGDYAKNQGTYAKNQGDYAKQEGDRLTHRGTYSSSLTYYPNNIVRYNGSAYVNIVQSTNILPTDTNYWRLLVEKAPVDSVNGYTGVVSLNNTDVGAIKDEGVPSIIANFIAQRPTAGVSNRLFVSTDEQKIYRDTSTQWLEFKIEWSNVLNKALATSTTNGLMSSTDKSKLDGVESGAINKTTADGLYVKIAGGDSLTGLFKLPNIDPTDPLHPVSKKYADALKNGLDYKDSVRVATTSTEANIDIDKAPVAIDGVTLAVGDRILVKDNAYSSSAGETSTSSSSTRNGLYEVTSIVDSNGDNVNDYVTLVRTSDADEDSEVTSGLFTFVEEGTENLNSGFVLATDGTITLGVANLTFVKFSGAGQITAGTGLTKSGDTLSIANTGVTGGTYTKVDVNAQGQITTGYNPTTLSGYGITDATPSSHIGSGGTEHAEATTTTAGFMSTTDKSKLDGIASGAEVNQSAFSNILVGTTTVSADTKTDTLELKAGDGVSLTADATNDNVSFAVVLTNSAHGNLSGGSLHSVATTSTAGFMSASDKTKLDGLGSSSNAWANFLVGTTTISADTSTDTLEMVAGESIALTPDATNDKVTFAVSLTDTGHGTRGGGNLHALATTTVAGFMGSTDKSKLNGIEAKATATAYPVIQETEPTTGLVSGLVWWKDSAKEAKMYLNNAFESIGGTPPVISTTEPTTNLKEGLHWYNPDTKTTKVYLDGAFRDVGGGMTALSPYRNTVTLSSDASTVNVGINNFDPTLDILLVYKNSVYLQEGIDYTVATDGSSITSTNSVIWASGTEFNFLVIASVPENNAFDTVRLKNTYTSTIDGDTNIPIGITEFNPDTDILEVYKDNLLMYETDQWVLNANNTSIDLQGWALNNGEKIVFHVWKQVRKTTNILDGGLLADGSVANIKLDTDIKVGSLASLPFSATSVTDALITLDSTDQDNEVLIWMGV